MRLQNELLVQKFVPVDLGVVDLLLQPSLVVHLAIHQNCLTSHREVYIAKLIRMKTSAPRNNRRYCYKQRTDVRTI